MRVGLGKFGGAVGWLEAKVMVIRAKIAKLLSGVAQSILSLSFNLGGLIAGGILALYLDVFSISPWALALLPGILSVRGAIGGLFSGRLSTALHIGTIKSSYAGNTKSFYLLLSSIVVLAFESGVIIGSALFVIGFFLWNLPLVSYIEILAVISGAMGLSILLVSPITMQVSFLSFKHGLDPDVLVYPVTSTVADILVTLCYVTVLNVFFSTEIGHYLIYFSDLLFLATAVVLLSRNFKETEFLKTLREFFITLLIVTVVVNITGSALSKMRKVIEERPEVLAVYPALIDTMGDFGSIIGSTATTKLFIGLVKPSFSSIRQHAIEIFSAWASSVVMFIAYLGIASIAYEVRVADSLALLTKLLVTNVLAAFFMAFIAYAVAILTFRRALDPDNFVIPIESSIADAVTTIFLFAALAIIT